MEKYIQYILKRDREVIFSSKYEAKVINKILGDTMGYQKLLDIESSLDENDILATEWINRGDIHLANFSFNMFIHSKKLLAADLCFEDFKTLWEHYLLTSDYYIQAANYMLNSDDYLYGERYKLKAADERPKRIYKSNFLHNMKQRHDSFRKHPEQKSAYIHTISKIGIELSYLIQN